MTCIPHVQNDKLKFKDTYNVYTYIDGVYKEIHKSKEKILMACWKAMKTQKVENWSDTLVSIQVTHEISTKFYLHITKFTFVVCTFKPAIDHKNWRDALKHSFCYKHLQFHF